MQFFTDAIVFGPFSSEYHRTLVDDTCKRALESFIRVNLLRQLDHPYSQTRGKFWPCYNDEQYVGPRSLVRDLFHFEFKFQDGTDVSELKTELEYDPQQHCFRVRPRHQTYLWTPARKLKRKDEASAIQELVREIQEQQIEEAQCPICSQRVAIVDRADLFDVRCPKFCFFYQFHRDRNGEFLHGHFLMYPPHDDTDQAPLSA